MSRTGFISLKSLAILILAAALVVLAGYVLSTHSQSKPSISAPADSSSQGTATGNNSGSSKALGTTAVQQCHTSGLVASVSMGSHAAGTAYQILKLTNNTSADCTVLGFPGISLLDANSNQLGSPATRNGAAGSAVTLAPGASTYSALGFPSASNFGPGVCSANSANLRIYPPNETTTLVIPDVQQYCPGFSVGSLSANSP